MVALWNAFTMAVIETDEGQECFEGSVYFFKKLTAFWNQKNSTGNPVTIGSVWKHFSKIEKERDLSIIRFYTNYKGGTIQEIQAPERGKRMIKIKFD